MCRFAGEIISDGEANVRENNSYMFNLDNKVSLEVCLVKDLLKYTFFFPFFFFLSLPQA